MIQYVAVLPAYAGMFLSINDLRQAFQSSPRVCGDVSRAVELSQELMQFSPRMRGCF